MERWSGILKVPLHPNGRARYRVAASLCLSSTSKMPITPCANAIFFNGDRVEGTGDPVIERLSDPLKIAEILVSKLGSSVNAWVIEPSTFKGSFAVYKDFIPSVNQWGEPQCYNPNRFPASTSIVSLLSNCLKEAKNIISGVPEELYEDEVSASNLRHPKTILLGFSKGGTVLNQLVSELGLLEFKTTENPSQVKKEKQIIPTSKETLLNSITEIHYLDVGLNSAGAYLTDPDVVNRISDRIMKGALGIRFLLHGTPRQWHCSMRVLIREEKDALVQLLKAEALKSDGKLQVCEKLYFADNHPNLQMHFQVIEKFDAS